MGAIQEGELLPQFRSSPGRLCDKLCGFVGVQGGVKTTDNHTGRFRRFITGLF